MADGEEGLGYWMRWEVPVCGLIIVAPLAAAVVVLKGAKPDPLMSVALWVPCWRVLHPLWLLAFRGLVFLVMSWLLFQFVLVHGIFQFFFYTQWTFTLVVVYFGIATLMSAHGCWIYSKHVTKNEEADLILRKDLGESTPETLNFAENKNKNPIKYQSYNDRGENEQKAGFWGYLMQIIYQTSAGAAILTDIVFWCLLVPFLSGDHSEVNLVAGCMHSLNIVFLLLDSILNSLPFPWFRMAYFVFWSCSYIIFQWVLHVCGFSWWPYPFLELATPWAPVWYLSMALVHIPCYVLYYVIIKAKNSCFPKFYPRAYLRA